MRQSFIVALAEEVKPYSELSQTQMLYYLNFGIKDITYVSNALVHYWRWHMRDITDRSLIKPDPNR